jgi:hypothetical protein
MGSFYVFKLGRSIPGCTRPARGVLSQPSFGGSGQGCFRLRASNEHILIVRVPRARTAPGQSFRIPPGLFFLSPRRGTGVGSLWQWEEDHASTFPLEGGLDGLPLRVSTEGSLRPRVARAQETI